MTSVRRQPSQVIPSLRWGLELSGLWGRVMMNISYKSDT